MPKKPTNAWPNPSLLRQWKGKITDLKADLKTGRWTASITFDEQSGGDPQDVVCSGNSLSYQFSVLSFAWGTSRLIASWEPDQSIPGSLRLVEVLT